MANESIRCDKVIPGDDVLLNGKRRTVNIVASWHSHMEFTLEPLSEEEPNVIKVAHDQMIHLVGTSYDPAKHGRPLST